MRRHFLSLLQAVINSTITPNMTFTKTSQKFGQWSDIRANTVYGLGFGTEADLTSVSIFVMMHSVIVVAAEFRNLYVLLITV